MNKAVSRSLRVVEWIVHLRRLTRIALAAIFSLALALMITPIVDNVYTNSFYDPNTRMIPALISAVVGLAFYALGWRLIIGYAGETPSVRPVVLWYIGVGTAACAVVVVLVVVGAISGTLE